MRTTKTYLCALATSLLVFAAFQGVKADDDDCCGDTAYNPNTEECCGGTTIVAKGRCCNGTELQAGFECCNKLSPPRPYNPETTCCTESALHAKGTVLPIAISKCPDRVANPNYEPVQDGCGLPGFEYIVPQTDFTTTVSFKECCNAHDLCYQICNASRSGCDSTFIHCLNSACAQQLPTVLAILFLPSCTTGAGIYWQAVVQFGEDGFNDAQRRSCQCCP